MTAIQIVQTLGSHLLNVFIQHLGVTAFTDTMHKGAPTASEMPFLIIMDDRVVAIQRLR